ncbi:MAG: MATE family efflux transporter [Anaerovoracaceae bacterium]
MINKQFWQHVLPAMISFAFSGIYAIVDGVFIGQNVGDAGLAAINIAYPLAALIQATGAGIGMAGSVWLAICIGQGAHEKEKKYLETTGILLLGASVFLTLVLSFTYIPILKLFGASGIILEYANSYIRIIILGAVFQILSVGLIPIIRNYNGSILAMAAMIGGFTTNVVLDWLFIAVLGYGTGGGAVATIISEFVTMVPCLIFLIIKQKPFNFKSIEITITTIKEIMLTAVSPMGLILCPNIVIIILNKGAIIYGGSTAVACYALISYVLCVVQLLLQGIGDGAQPLIGRYYGANDKKSLHKVEKMAYIFAPATAFFCCILLFVTQNLVPILFGASDDAGAMYIKVLPFFIAGLVFWAFSRITTSIFYATQKNKFAYILIYGEPLLLAIFVGLVLPRFIGLGLIGVWISVPLAQFCLAAVSLILIFKGKKSHKNL